MSTKQKSQKALIAEEREAEDITYMNSFTKNVLRTFKNSPVKSLRCDKLYATYLGSVYTFLYNTVPVTIKFDGTVQQFPEPVYDRIVAKLQEISNSNTSHVEEAEL